MSVPVPDYVIVVAGYVLVLLTSGVLVKLVVGSPSESTETGDAKPGSGRDAGRIIGKCENILAITLVLADAVTGLALLVAAKSIVRSEDIRRDSRYYLGGTLVNLTYSVLVGYGLRLLL